ncbi:hypothetical protein LguiA_029362 [Lonicera macranthoides]
MASLFFTFLFPLLLLPPISAIIVFEEGYTVSTVLDGNKLDINPYSILPRYGSSDLVVLDSAGSSFYTLSFSKSQESEIKRFSGTGVAGYLDGDSGSAMFNQPKSFALDFKGNVYVADRSNHVIRKISNSGVTTIAGGYSQIPGHADGPAQNATFSDDFALAFIPERCALMISDHGNKLIRQINLKVEDCATSSQSVLGMASAWALGLVVASACLLGLIVGFFVRPYILSHGGSNPLHISETWKHYPIAQVKRIQTFCFDIRSVIVNSTQCALVKKLLLLIVSQLSLMFRPKLVVNRTAFDKSASLLDSDDLSCSEISKSNIIDDQLKDLISLDGGLELAGASGEILERTDGDDKENTYSNIDNMMYANIMGFAEEAKRTSGGEFMVSSSGLVKRR